MAVVIGAAIALTGAAFVLLVDWERVRALADAAFGDVTAEGGWRGIRDGVAIGAGILVVCGCFFVGLVVIGQTVWGAM